MTRTLRLDRAAERLHALGPRAVAELLAAIDAPLSTVERFAAIDPDMLRAVGGDRFPPAALYVVREAHR